MKKSLFMLGVAVAALTSCTQSEVLDVAEGNAIKFGNAFVGKPTRAVTSPELNKENINDIYVFADKGTGGNVFTTNNWHVYRVAGQEWGYDGDLVKWEDANYNFIAYAGKKLNTDGTDNKVEYASTSDKNALKFSNIIIDNAEGNQYDLLYSKAITRKITSGSGDKSEINFTFNHLLSMVQFTLNSGFGKDVTLTISDFKFYGVKTKGNYVGTNGSDDAAEKAVAWTLDGNRNNEGSAFEAPTDPEDVAQYDPKAPKSVVNSWFVIPQSNVDSGNDPVEMVKFKVVAKDKTNTETKVIAAKLPKITWEKGNRYNYILNIDPTAMGIEEKYITFGNPEITPLTDSDTTLESGNYEATDPQP